MGIIVDAISAAQVKGKIWNLTSCRNDLSDDGGAIGVYNKLIDRVITDVQSMIGSQNSRAIVNKLCGYTEPNQGSDRTLSAAREYIQREINYLNGQVESGGGCR